jgi:hypothetical protein
MRDILCLPREYGFECKTRVLPTKRLLKSRRRAHPEKLLAKIMYSFSHTELVQIKFCTTIESGALPLVKHILRRARKLGNISAPNHTGQAKSQAALYSVYHALHSIKDSNVLHNILLAAGKMKSRQCNKA